MCCYIVMFRMEQGDWYLDCRTLGTNSRGRLNEIAYTYQSSSFNFCIHMKYTCDISHCKNTKKGSKKRYVHLHSWILLTIYFLKNVGIPTLSFKMESREQQLTTVIRLSLLLSSVGCESQLTRFLNSMPCVILAEMTEKNATFLIYFKDFKKRL